MGSHRRPDMRLAATTWRVSGRYPDCRAAIEAALPPCPPATIYRPRHSREDTTTMTTTAEEKWGPGPWQSEPDRAQWTDETTGLECLAVRHGRSGHWCGYVAVPPGDPWFGVDYADLPREDLDVHWGLNYSRAGDTILGLSATQPDGLWWFGFSCDHVGDLTPAEIVADEYGLRANDGVYRDLRFVRRECVRLADQITEYQQ